MSALPLVGCRTLNVSPDDPNGLIYLAKPANMRNSPTRPLRSPHVMPPNTVSSTSGAACPALLFINRLQMQPSLPHSASLHVAPRALSRHSPRLAKLPNNHYLQDILLPEMPQTWT